MVTVQVGLPENDLEHIMKMLTELREDFEKQAREQFKDKTYVRAL